MNTEIPTRAEPFADSRETITRAVADAVLKLSADARGNVNAPDVATVRGAFETVTTERVPRAVRERVAPRNRWRFRRSPERSPVQRADVSRVLLNRLRWHSGNGSATLHGTFSDVFYVGRETFETLDTIAAVYIHLFTEHGLKRSNNERWNAILGTSGARFFVLGGHSGNVSE